MMPIFLLSIFAIFLTLVPLHFRLDFLQINGGTRDLWNENFSLILIVLGIFYSYTFVKRNIFTLAHGVRTAALLSASIIVVSLMQLSLHPNSTEIIRLLPTIWLLPIIQSIINAEIQKQAAAVISPQPELLDPNTYRTSGGNIIVGSVGYDPSGSGQSGFIPSNPGSTWTPWITFHPF